VAVLGGLFVLLGGVLIFGLGAGAAGGTLSEAWVSDTPRDNEVNHHAVGVGPDGEVIVAPVAEVPHSDATITNTSCALVRLDPEDGSVLWRAGMPAADCFTHALTEPAIEDIDDDGGLEVVVSTTENALVVHDAATGTEEWRVPLATYGYGRPTVAKVTTAHGQAVVTSDINGHVVLTRGDGTEVWRSSLQGTGWDGPAVWEAPVVDDIDGDGQSEILVGTNRGPALLSADGSLEWHRNGSAVYTTVADTDGDPTLDVITAGTATVRAYDGSSGRQKWTRSVSGPRLRTAADADEDGRAEVYVGRVGGDILALDGRTGETEWVTSLSRSEDAVVVPPVLGDVTGDGRPEVIGVTNTGTVVILDADSGDQVGRYERSVPVRTFATPADIDDDGRAEILVRYGDGRVVALDMSATHR
jgi:outer membrane protein assembly factor BamB